MIKERPILFNGEMVLALLAGEKTQMRRVINPQPEHRQFHEWEGQLIYEGEHRVWCWQDKTWDLLLDSKADRDELAALCPYGVPGDRLWVRETWVSMGKQAIIYQATNIGYPVSQWRPSIHMPRWASRITLEITKVRVERLHDISEADAQAEGVGVGRRARLNGDRACIHCGAGERQHIGWARACFGRSSVYDPKTFKGGFCLLWQQTNGTDSWLANPWVWVVEFNRLDSGGKK